jgi:hypothetical protein
MYGRVEVHFLALFYKIDVTHQIHAALRLATELCDAEQDKGWISQLLLRRW